MIASWPEELPRPDRNGWQRTAGEGRRRSQRDGGPPKVARRYSLVPDLVSMTIDVTRSEKARFDRFYRDELRRGTLPFLMPDPTTSGWQLLTGDEVPLVTDAGVPLLLEETWVCLFGENLPTETVYGVRFRISFDIAVMP